MNFLQGRKQYNARSSVGHSLGCCWWRPQVEYHELLGRGFGSLVQEVARWENSMIRGLVEEATTITSSWCKENMSTPNTSWGLLVNSLCLTGSEHGFLLSGWEGVRLGIGSPCVIYYTRTNYCKSSACITNREKDGLNKHGSPCVRYYDRLGSIS